MKKKQPTTCTKCGQAVAADALTKEQREYVEHVLQCAASLGGVSPQSIVRRNRTAALSNVRVAVAVTLGDAGLTQSQIAQALDNRNRSTISNMLGQKRKARNVRILVAGIKEQLEAPCF